MTSHVRSALWTLWNHKYVPSLLIMRQTKAMIKAICNQIFRKLLCLKSIEKKLWAWIDFSCLPPVDLYLIFEKSSCKNQVQQTGFLVTQAVKIMFEID